jgi:hypothetical protein
MNGGGRRGRVPPNAPILTLPREGEGAKYVISFFIVGYVLLPYSLLVTGLVTTL